MLKFKSQYFYTSMMAETTLPSLVEVNTKLVKKIQEDIQNMIDRSQEKLGKPCTFRGDFCHTDCQLPLFNKMNTRMETLYKLKVLDIDMMQDLHDALEIITRMEKSSKLFSVNVPRDGNCLLHAVSFAVWGVDDEKHILLQLMLLTLNNNSNNHYQIRQQRERLIDTYHLHSERSGVKQRKGEKVTEGFSSAGHSAAYPTASHMFMERIHIYVLANILRRPIIVISNNTVKSFNSTPLQESDLGGIYLPLEWLPLECCKNPIILGFSVRCKHFCPMLSVFQPEVKKPHMVSLVSKDLSVIPLRCLKEEEDQIAWQLLQDYLLVKEIQVTNKDAEQINICVALSSPIPIPFYKNTLEDYFQMCNGDSQHQLTEPEHRGALVDTAPEGPHQGAPNSQKSMEKQPSRSGLHMHGTNQFQHMQGGSQTKVVPKLPEFKDSLTGSVPKLSNDMGERLTPSAPLLPESLCCPTPVASIMKTRCANACGYWCSDATYPLCHECHDLKLKYDAANFQGIENKQPDNHRHVDTTISSEENVNTYCYGHRDSAHDAESSGTVSPPLLSLTHTADVEAEAISDPQKVIPIQGCGLNYTEISSKQTQDEGHGDTDSTETDRFDQVQPRGGIQLWMCMSPSCHKMVDSHTEKCEQCEYILSVPSHMMGRLRIEATSLPECAVDNLTPQKRRGKHCVTAACPNYGDPANADMCSSCFFKFKHVNASNYIDSQKEEELSSRRENRYNTTEEFCNTSVPNQSVNHREPKQPLACTSPQAHSTYVIKDSEKQRHYSEKVMSNLNNQKLTSVLVTSMCTAHPLSVPPSRENILGISREDHSSSGTSQISPTTENMYSSMLGNCESSAKIALRKCKMSACENYGNPQKEGCCNSCFPCYKLQQEEISRYRSTIPCEVPDCSPVA